MIKIESTPSNSKTSDEDFTEENYSRLLKIAKQRYNFLTYDEIDYSKNFVLWRHDVDFSLNRALRLAELEYDEGVRSTYFLDPHSRNYNLAEAEQHKLVKRILNLNHSIGLHFDPSIYDIDNVKKFEKTLRFEAEYLAFLFGVQPFAFSFHNPVQKLLDFDADYYGGLLNCYSTTIKSNMAYCSDSNGYWRFDRMEDFLRDNGAKYLHVLTHPGWWQKQPGEPRKRFYRAAYGRMRASIKKYDALLSNRSKVNQSRFLDQFSFLKNDTEIDFELLDNLYNTERFEQLYIVIMNVLLAYIKDAIIDNRNIDPRDILVHDQYLDLKNNIKEINESHKKLVDFLGKSCIGCNKRKYINEDDFLQDVNPILRALFQLTGMNK